MYGSQSKITLTLGSPRNGPAFTHTQDNHMKTKTLLMITLLAACIAPSISHANKSGKGDKKAPDTAKLFQKLDADSNGGLSAAEVADNKKLSKRFTKLDKNKDGELSLKEFEASQKTKKGKKAKKEKSDNDSDEE